MGIRFTVALCVLAITVVLLANGLSAWFIPAGFTLWLLGSFLDVRGKYRHKLPRLLAKVHELMQSDVVTPTLAAGASTGAWLAFLVCEARGLDVIGAARVALIAGAAGAFVYFAALILVALWGQGHH